MRIIAGHYRGRQLVVPKGNHTRPTADRVKESLFSILGDRMMDSDVLDCFAGAGTLGLEALSRGARKAVFIDRDPAAYQAIQANIQRLAAEPYSQVIYGDSLLTLKKLDGQQFHFIFIDPPYQDELAYHAIQLCFDHKLLRPNGIITVEHDSRFDPTAGRWDIIDQRKYGKTYICFLQ